MFATGVMGSIKRGHGEKFRGITMLNWDAAWKYADDELGAFSNGGN